MCERRVIRKEYLEGWIVDQINIMLKKYYETPEGISEIRRLIDANLNDSTPAIGEELDIVEKRLIEINKTITNLIDNLTATNREYVGGSSS